MIKGLLKNRFFLAGAAIVLVLAISIGLVIAVRNNTEVKDVDSDNTGEIKEIIKLSAEDIILEPISYDSAGIETDTNFKIKVKKEIDNEQLRMALAVKPDRGFTVRDLSQNEFELKFDEPLEADSIYRFTLNQKEDTADFFWAFQTKKEYKVLRTLPRDKGTGVPVNSGIEISFTHEGMESLDNYFEISPKVNGYFEYHKKVAVFVPESLEYGTVYTVTLKKGLGLNGSNEKTKEDMVFQFQTQLQDNTKINHFFNFAQVMYNFTDSETPALVVYGDEYYQKNDFTVQVYGYKDADSFLKDLNKYDETPKWAQRDALGKLFDKSKLVKVTEFKAKLFYAESPWYQQMLQFPDKLPEGYYYVSVNLDGHEYYAHIQVNNLSVYFMSEAEDALLWINNSKTGAPEKDVSIKTEGIEATTDEQGIARLEGLKRTELNVNTSRSFMLKPVSGSTFIIKTFDNFGYYTYGYYGMYGNNYTPANQKYWNYLYLDRGMYLTDDTVRFWGLVKPRTDEKDIEKVTVQLMKYSYDSYSEKQSVLVERELSLEPNGTYIGELSYQNFSPGSYFILVKAGDITFEQVYIQLEDYTKPAYKLSTSQDKEVCFLGEKINFGVQASFFEGSPVAGLTLAYNEYGGSDKMKNKSGILNCDSDGYVPYVSIPEEINNSTGMDWRPVYANVHFENANAEEEDVRLHASALVFPRDTMIDIRGKINDGKIELKASTNEIDITGIKKDDAYFDYLTKEYKFRGNSIDTAFKVKLIEKYWDKEKIGQYYDFINKVRRDKYNYFEVTRTIDEFTLVSVNGEASATIAVEGYSEYSSYYVEVTGKDTKSKPIFFTEYIYNSYIYGDYLDRMEMTKTYSISEENKKTNFKAGEKSSMKVLENEKDFSLPEEGRVLFMTLRNGMLDYSIKNSNRYDRIFEEGLIPNAFVKAVYFDGKAIYNAGVYGLYYDYSEKELEITLKADKNQYKPGDTVNLDVDVKDKQGKPSSAVVNFSVVDEAFFALREQYVNTVSSIYNYVFDTGIVDEYLSYNNVSARFPYAECGEGGDEGRVRSDFKDNAFFGNITTDENGKGTVSFKLPDNLTSWRITSQALTGDLKAGNTKININSKLPFFTTLIFNDVYLTGDKPGISLRSYGTEVSAGSNVKYEVVVEGINGYKKTFLKEQQASKFCNISLESLKSGEYSITVSSADGSHKDAIKKTFKVLDSILETAKTQYFSITEDLNIASGIDISSENTIVELSFYNKNLSKYNRALNMLRYSWGQRVDQVLARKMAAEHLKKYFNKESYEIEEDTKLSEYQIADGGIALLTYDSSNPELSAKISALGSEFFNKTDLEIYFSGIIDKKESPNEEIAAAYLGLASIDRPVLIDIRAFLKQEGISIKEKLYLGLALTELGDYSGAKSVYNAIIKEFLKTAGEYKYIDQGKGNNDVMEMTSLCSMMALRLKAPERDAFFDYITNKTSDGVLLNLEMMIYLQNTMPEAEKTGSLNVVKSDGKYEIKLTGTQREKMVMTYDELKNVKFTDVVGDIECAVKYIGPLKGILGGNDSLVKITRTYSVKSVEKIEFIHSDIVRVSLKIDFGANAPEGYYQITDVLPSGLRFIQSRNWNWENWQWGTVNGQKIMFGYHYNKLRTSDIISYYARVAAPGTYTADDSVIKHAKSQVYSFSGRKTVQIGED